MGMYLVGAGRYFPPGTPGENKTYYVGGKENAEEIVFHMSALANGRTQKEAWFDWNDVEKRSHPGLYKKGGLFETDKIADLNPDQFTEQVLRSDKMWIVEF